MIPETQGDFFLSQAWTPQKNIEIGLVSVGTIDISSNVVL